MKLTGGLVWVWNIWVRGSVARERGIKSEAWEYGMVGKDFPTHDNWIIWELLSTVRHGGPIVFITSESVLQWMKSY